MPTSVTTNKAINATQTTPLTRSESLQHAAIFAFGALIIFAVGFAPMQIVHNAAHDTRHSISFPCH
ncbi:CbtB domain-containing protein [Moritella yayanosii]|uniref:Cobalt transporter n=1 Tax=Moritella yayanosii TaxID=69539 RepID=A0A330LU26_9GAMM|nr:CbtB domain-containing protein [Moritella yayanosii]SQD80263.1 conserved protein of unknown function, containing conserved domain of Cobalt transporter subunit CbtB [Moritella yayanosii]